MMVSDLATLHQRWGICAYHQHDWPRAADYLQRAVELNPSLAEAWYFLGLAHHSLNQLTEAMADFDTALHCKGNLACLRRRGYVCMEAGDYAAALADFMRVFDADPADVETLQMSALLRLELGDYAGAVEDLTQAIDFSEPGDNSAELYACRSRAHRLLGDQVSELRDRLAAEG